MSDGQARIITTSAHPYRVLVAGRARAGKDTFGAMLAEASGGVLRTGPSTSEFYCQRMFGAERWSKELAFFKHSPVSRESLAQYMAEYNRTSETWPGARLYGEMVEAGIDVLVGIRRLAEVRACRKLHLLTHAVWVERDVDADTTLDYGQMELTQAFGTLLVVSNPFSLDFLRENAGRAWDWIRSGNDAAC